MAKSSSRRVLVTGAAGYIAGVNLPALRGRYDLVLLDVRATRRDGTAVEGVAEYDLAADIRGGYHPSERLRSLFRGIDAVFHCAYTHSDWKTLDGYQT
ncbi:MAG TPA: NAD-dependent epimerase/dehydratase family protein, partial [Chloroflexota bacterium]